MKAEMNDRELLELAAKAAGVEVIWNSLCDCFLRSEPGVGSVSWSPLTDDGDALRLAVKLGAGLNTSHPKTLCFSTANDVIESHGSDPYAATRRAIVRAAAEIGKQ